MANPTNFVKSDIGPIRRVATVHERESLMRAADVYGYGAVASDAYLPGAAGAAPVAMPHLQTKRARLNEQQKQVLKILADQTPEPTNPEIRDRLSKHADELKEKIAPYLQTNKELRATSYRDQDFMTAIRKAKDWSKPSKELGGRAPQDLAEDYKNIMRRLDPENPDADSLDTFRKDR